MHHVEFKAKAMLTRSFFETSADPSYRHSLFHNSLFRFHVLQERHLPDPGIPPNYSPEVFSEIRNVHQTSSLNVAKLSCSQWCHLFLEKLLKSPNNDEETPAEYTPCRTELANPQNDWEKTWRLARLQGLGPEITTFLWRLLHRLLPIQDRVHRITSNNSSSSPNCQLCQEGLLEDQQHAFFQCSFNYNA